MSNRIKAAIIAPIVAAVVGIVSAVGAFAIRKYRQAKEVIVEFPEENA